MSKANPRADEESQESRADTSAGSPSDSSPRTGPQPGAAAAGVEAPEEELRQTLEERYEELEQRYDEVRDMLEDYNRSAMDFIREHPGICIAGALGAGYVVGRLAARRWLV